MTHDQQPDRQTGGDGSGWLWGLVAVAVVALLVLAGPGLLWLVLFSGPFALAFKGAVLLVALLLSASNRSE